MHNKRIHKIVVEESSTEYMTLACDTYTPAEGNVHSFYVEETRTVSRARMPSWLVLDNYGNDVLSTAVRKRLFGESANKLTIAIEKRTGVIYTAEFLQQDMYTLQLLQLGMQLPAAWEKRMRELVNCKRPFYMTLPDRVLFELLEHEIGLRDIEAELNIVFDFSPNHLQLGKHMYREVTDWKPL